MSSRPSEWQQASTNSLVGRATVQTLRRLVVQGCSRLWAGVEARRSAHARRSLRVVETVGMGEKRFVAIVEVQQERFLVGGGTAGVSLLARLGAEKTPEKTTEPNFATVLDEQDGAPSSAEAQRAMLDARKEAW